VPTLVEVKRASDTRIRREVVGQLLDYAANAVVYWPIERLRELFVRECERAGRDPDRLIAEHAAPLEGEAFWGQAEDNLRAGRLRLVFVADEIPRELRRVIEFLNGQMTAEVLGVEVKQYVAEGVTTLVPRLLGRTAEADARKGRSPGRRSRRWDAQLLFATLAERRPEAEVAVARALYEWTLERGWGASFGSGVLEGSWIPVLSAEGREYRPLALYTTGSLFISFEPLARRPPFDEPQRRLELLDRLNLIPGVAINSDAIDRYPGISLATLSASPIALESLTRALDWFAETVLRSGD
jgi:hypothetical protein